MAQQFHILLNPRSLGRHRAKLDELVAILQKRGDEAVVLEPAGPEAMFEQTRKCLEEGARYILPAGGDGTLNICASAFLDKGRNLFPEAKLIPLNFGTGHDFYTGFMPKVEGYSWLLGDTEEKSISVGLVVDKKSQDSRYFFNTFSYGISGSVLDKRERAPLRDSKFSYFAATLRAIADFKPLELIARLDGRYARERTLLFMIGKGPVFGGGMRLIPEARHTSSEFTGLWIPALKMRTVLGNLHKIYTGAVASVDGVQALNFKFAELELRKRRNLLEVDGEIYETGRRVEISIIPNCLTLLRPKLQ